MKTNRECGAVLIIVLFILAGIALVSMELGRNVLLDHAFSRTIQASMTAKPLLQSGESLAAYFLVKDFQTEKKEAGQESIAALNKRFNEWLTIYVKDLKNSSLEISISDENGRFPLRALFPTNNAARIRAESYKEIFERMLTCLLILHGFDQGEDMARVAARHFLESLLAWGGMQMMTEEARDWYLNRDIPFLPPGRPPESMEELLLLYWPDVDGELAQNVLLGTAEIPGLLENCSLWSRGPINLNTMGKVVGWGLAPDYDAAIAFMEDLEEERLQHGDLLPDGWHLEIFARHGRETPPSQILSDKSRWHRITTTVWTGAAKNSSESVGWLDNTSFTWVGRAIM